MAATAQRPIPIPIPITSAAARCPLAGAEARALALGYLRYVSALWRGDARAAIFPLRLGAYWRSDLPHVPVAAPDAVSPHGGGGRGIEWYQSGGDVIGYVPGGCGGYRVLVAAVAQLVRSAPIGP